MEKITLTARDDFTTLDLLLFRHFKRQVPSLVEQVLRENPGLSAKGVFLPRGTSVAIANPASVAKTPKPLITLWQKAS